MEISRREYGRSFYEGPSRLDRRNSRFANSEPSINYNSWNKRFSPIDPDFQPDTPHLHRPQRAPLPYQRKQPVQRSQPPTTSSNKIPSLLKLPPQPLFPPEDVERLRASLRKFPRRSEPEPYDDCDDSPPTMGEYAVEEEYYSPPMVDEHTAEEEYCSPSAVDEHLTEEEYMREEQQTKQQIEEIIAVAQALREKLDREEELRRQAEQSIPKLMDLKPKIPSLLEIYVPPPDPEEMCWNCKGPGHRFDHCNMNQQRKFCYRCGAPGFDVSSCPFCTTSE